MKWLLQSGAADILGLVIANQNAVNGQHRGKGVRVGEECTCTAKKGQEPHVS
jgi:hypothetical protein